MKPAGAARLERAKEQHVHHYRAAIGRRVREGLHLERQGIRFANLNPHRVRIEIEVENRSAFCSAATPLRIESAPLGAFVRWQPLTSLGVPPLGPGERTVVRTEVPTTPVLSLGGVADVPPKKLLTAASAGDADDRILEHFGARRHLIPVRHALAADLHALFGRGHTHWAGNLNVFVGRRSVERHRAQALRILPGRTNFAHFVVGAGQDAYAFELTADNPHWKSWLADVTMVGSLFPREALEAPVPSGEWIETPRGVGQFVMVLGVVPPEGCSTGGVTVHVTQRSTGAETAVEFDFDTNAAGPGCYAA